MNNIETNNLKTKETFELIERTINEVEGKLPIERLIQDCADKLSISEKEVREVLEYFNSKLLD